MQWPAQLPVPRAILFDLDGVIVDSAPAHAAAWTALFREHGIHFTAADYAARAAGRPREAVIRDVLGERPDHDALMARKVELMAGLDDLPLIPGTMAFVRALHLPFAVATSSRVPDLLLGGAGVADAFPVVVNRAEVERGKPAPDLFVEAARRLGIPPSEALVVEDAAAGVEAGLAAGCTVVGLAGGGLERAHLVVPSLPLRWIREWSGGSPDPA